jgi:mono/diheme cytochrome c family protein
MLVQLTRPFESGANHFAEMCVQCHGGPGESPGQIAKGLWPEAPDLAKAVSDWTPGEFYWITKNGIKFSAMPGWGATHSDEKIWEIVAFLEKLPSLTPAEYQQMQTRPATGNEWTGTPQ